jgi:hypothetical protein
MHRELGGWPIQAGFWLEWGSSTGLAQPFRIHCRNHLLRLPQPSRCSKAGNHECTHKVVFARMPSKQSEIPGRLKTANDGAASLW